MAITVFVALAGLMGAAGIALAAASAHAAPGTGLDGAAYMLLFHAAAIVGGAALTQNVALWRPLALLVLMAWVIGALLFSGDIAMRAFAGHPLFPYAAPSGGMIMIGAWLALTVAAIAQVMRA